MGLKGCEVQLDNPWNTYYAGQTLNGQVKFTFDSPKKVRGESKIKYFFCGLLIKNQLCTISHESDETSEISCE